ncbi:HAUS augmin-like complex subunit 3-like protein [Nonomuraea polychroma]|uniref:HAUS augmin-like complex subunit 3-like protein n=1 Tax=Nonomuraea polychroma TaxID=46176 RepID=A0A438M5Q7_9ACTN|nr:hypothetical protein [Nonomuraea polychroma]RVX41139.1 HAUS augmin-like complex subunit 3-like protein [Nonomuraea polychroma]
MILISAGLVIASVVLLIAGFVASAVPLISASIVTSILAALFLVLGGYIRRKELFPQAAAQLVEPEPALEDELATIAKTLLRQAARLAEVEADVRARAAEAEKLQIEAKEHARRARESQEYAAAQEKAAEAVEEVLKNRTDTLAKFFAHQSRKTQISFLVIGAVLGGVVGVGIQELVNLL